MKPALVNYALYQAGWFACVAGAGSGRSGAGMTLALLLFAAHVLLADDRRAELRLALAAGVLGFCVDSVLVSTGVLVFPTGQPLAWAAPPWIVVMWLQFATTFRFCMAWLQGRSVTAAIFGAIGGPLAYLGGSRLGAVNLPDVFIAVCALGIVWAAALPLLLRVARSDGMPGRYRFEAN